MDKISISCFSPYRLDSWLVDLSEESMMYLYIQRSRQVCSSSSYVRKVLYSFLSMYVHSVSK